MKDGIRRQEKTTPFHLLLQSPGGGSCSPCASSPDVSQSRSMEMRHQALQTLIGRVLLVSHPLKTFI